MTDKCIKSRIAILCFLEFAVWGSYLTSMGSYLGNAGAQFAGKIGYFYTMQGVVSLFMPALIGILADRLIQAQKTLALCHGLAGLFMIACAWVGYTQGGNVDFATLFTLYSLSIAFFMPTIALVNSVSYNALSRNGHDPEQVFPKVRIWGTIGFIAMMLLVNFLQAPSATFQSTPEPISFQKTYHQFLICGLTSIVMFLYSFSMPACPVAKSEKKLNLADTFGLQAFKLFKIKDMAIFFIFSMFLGVSLQITNGFANPFISHFSEVEGFKGGWWSENANLLISISQLSETICILLIPWAMRKFDIKGVMLISMFAWVLRFGFFGIGDTGSGIWLLILSCIVYGVAFDFFNISGSLYVERRTQPEIRSSAQGLFMLMTNGVGATLGTIAAQKIINNYTVGVDFGSQWLTMDKPETAGWAGAWLVFAAYALVVAVAFIFIFKPKKN